MTSRAFTGDTSILPGDVIQVERLDGKDSDFEPGGPVAGEDHDADLCVTPTSSGNQNREVGALRSDEAEAKRVLRKIDRRLMPMMCTIYMLQFLDKSAMSYAAVYTFRQDRNLSTRDYSWLGTSFYLGYLCFEPVGSWLLQKTRTSWFVACTVVAWGSLLMAMAGPQHFRGLIAVRTLLGAAESVVTPGFALITARFYKREEQPFRFAVWYSCNGLGGMIGGLLGYGLGHIVNTGLDNWAWIFILNGLVTILAGMVFFLLCPNSPSVARFLTPHEKKIALERVRTNQSSLEHKNTNWSHVREALNPFEDPQGWLLFLATFSLTVPNGGLGNFLHLILQSYGYSPFHTILMGIPTGAVQAIIVISGGYVARRYSNMRIIVGVFFICWALLGVTIQFSTTRNGARLFGYYILVGFIPALAQIFSMPAANVTGYTKRVTVQGMIFIGYSAGNAVGPQFWKPGQHPPFRDGMLTCIVCFSVAIVFLLILRFWYAQENRRRDRIQLQTREKREPDFSDITDMENLSFRYML